MTKIYLSKFKTMKALAFLMMFAALSLMAVSASGQAATLNWLGKVNNDAGNPENWDPQMDYLNQIVKVDTATHYPVPPRFTAKRNDQINGLTLSNRAEIYIAKPDTNTFYLYTGSANYYLTGIINLESGRFNTTNNRNFYLETTEAKVIVSGSGYFNAQGTTSIGNRTATAKAGGHLVIKDSATYFTKDIIRFQNDPSVSTITILDKGKFIIPKDYRTDFQNRIINGQIHSDANHDIQMDFNLLTTTITLSARSKDVLYAYPTDYKNLTVNEDTLKLFALVNRGFQNLKDVEWKYTKTPGSGYKSFKPVVSGDTVKLVFSEAGMFYVAFQGTKQDGSVGTSNEVPVLVAQSYVKLDVPGVQYLRPGQYGGKITCTDYVNVTSREWKFSKTPGTGYTSFAIPETGKSYIPHFSEAGVYFVSCFYETGIQTHQTKEVTINVANHNFTIYWLGQYGDTVNNVRNWNPMSNIQWMTLNVPANSTIWPRFVSATNDTITAFALYNGSKVYVNKPAGTLINVRTSDTYLTGELIVNSGKVEFPNALRLTSPYDILRINGDAEVHVEKWLIMGNAATSTSGGHIKLTGNAKLTLGKIANDVWRWVTANDSLSTWYITGNAKVIFKGNAYNNYMGLVETGDIYTDAGRMIRVFYNEIDTTTTVYSVSETAFNLEDKSEIIVGVGKSTKSIKTKNTTGITAFEWKYTTTPGSGYKSFDPKQTAASLVAKFDSAKTYYIVCEGSDGTNKMLTEEVKVTVVSVVVAPGDMQNMAAMIEGKPLTVTESVTVDSREWKVSTTPGSGYAAIFPPAVEKSYTPLFLDNGIYYVVCESLYKTVPILSNEVKFIIGNVGIEDLDRSSFRLYPNPAPGAFYIGSAGTDFSMSLIDMTGKTVMQKKFENVTGDQLIRYNGKGIYFVRLTTGEKVASRPIILE